MSKHASPTLPLCIRRQYDAEAHGINIVQLRNKEPHTSAAGAFQAEHGRAESTRRLQAVMRGYWFEQLVP